MLLLYICRLIFLDCMFIFFRYTLTEQLNLRSKIRARKKSCNFLKMKLFISKGTQEVIQTEAMWRSKNKIFLSPEDVWSANVVWCWRVVRQNTKLSYVTFWSRDHKKSRIKLKTKYQGLWPPNLEGWWLMMAGSHSWSHMTLWHMALLWGYMKNILLNISSARYMVLNLTGWWLRVKWLHT